MMNQDQQNFNATWHNYSEHLRAMLKDMSSDDFFADVTLVTDDKKHIKAHKNILSACSSVFKEILQINSDNNHQVIYLRGIHHYELKCILQFIYLGESNFHEERMEELLLVAKNLGIQQFEINSEDGDSESGDEDKTNIQTKRTPIESEDAGEPNKLDIDHDDGQYKAENRKLTKGDINNLPIETQDVVEPSKLYDKNAFDQNKGNNKTGSNNVYRYECHQCEKAYIQKSHLKSHTRSVHDRVKYVCNQCEQRFARQDSLTKHIQSVHEGVKYACKQCDQLFKQQYNLTTHIKSVHKRIKYDCNHCEYKATEKGCLRKHIQSVHEGVKYTCNQCDKQFSEKSKLSKHMKTKHQ